MSRPQPGTFLTNPLLMIHRLGRRVTAGNFLSNQPLTSSRHTNLLVTADRQERAGERELTDHRHTARSRVIVLSLDSQSTVNPWPMIVRKGSGMDRRRAVGRFHHSLLRVNSPSHGILSNLVATVGYITSVNISSPSLTVYQPAVWKGWNSSWHNIKS